jgi:hypothetical protein
LKRSGSRLRTDEAGKPTKFGSSYKVKYNSKDSDDSDALSDSEPSDDNLEAGEIMKLIPKKFGKQKYLKGIVDRKKQAALQDEKKEIKKRPKAELMPCMSSSKKERNKQPEAAVKRPFVPRQVVATMKQGGKQRDVGTQITYTGDGRNLSLMELDILYTSGCKWSKIIYPGYKGVRLPYAEGGLSADQLIKEAFTKSNRVQAASPSQHLMNTPFKAEGARGPSFIQKQSLSAIQPHYPNSAAKQEFKPFFFDQKQATSEQSSKVLQSLQKKIQDSKLSESKCLFGSANQNTSNEKSASKKR